MHETMVAHGLLTAITAEAKKQNARPVGARISCGQLNAINDEVLRFAFSAVARNTPLEGMNLEIEHKPLQGRCRSCGQVFEVDISQPGCLECSSDNFELLPDAPLVLEEIKFQTE